MTKRPRSLHGSRYETAEVSPGFLFWKTFNSWSRRIRTELEHVDLTQVQYSILATLAYLSTAQDHVSQQDVAHQLSMDKMMVSDVVKTLERKKLLARAAHPEDGRSFSLSLTAAGRRRLNDAVPLVEAADEKFFRALKPGQLKLLAACLGELSMVP